MSCYQVLVLDNNKGDLSITQGNTVNLAQVIQTFSVKTPVIDFKIDGSVLELYYRDANGALQLKTVTLPASGNNSSAITVASTQTVTASIQSGTIRSSVNISLATGNALSANPDGLFVPTSDLTVTVSDSPSVSMSNTGGTISSSLIVSPFAGNALIIRNDGAYVAPNTLTNSQVRNLFSGTAPIVFDATTGIISETQATTSTPGFVTASDWNLFNAKLNNVVGVGSSSSTPVYKQTVSGVAQIRPVAGGAGISVSLIGDDIIISQTASVPVVNAGAPQSIATPTSSITMNGNTSVSSGTIAANLWSLVSGPNTPVIADTSLPNTVISNLVVGVYKFRLSAISSLGLVGTTTTTVTVSSGTITLDTIYIGVQDGATPPDATAVAAGVSSMQNGANDVAADWSGLTSSTPKYCWFAIPNTGGSYFKTKWFVDALNHGNIGGSTDLFGSYTQVTVGGIVYNCGITQYQTQFVSVCQLQA